jgi:hypothetical protein
LQAPMKPRFAVFLCLRQITNQNARKRIKMHSKWQVVLRSVPS